ncbi:MAG: hypothetical protein GY842_15845, partial [bacterium]|nr:hypothetical protein [bacterium]
MYQANIALPDDLFRQAERKASSEGVNLSEVVRSLVARWVTDEVTTSESDTTRQQTLDKAIASYGMWSDRDP